MSWQSQKQQSHCSISGHILTPVRNAAERESHSHSGFQLQRAEKWGNPKAFQPFPSWTPRFACIGRQVGWKRFVEPADPINNTFTPIRISLSGWQEMECIAQFFCRPVGQLLLDKWLQASWEGGHPAFCWRGCCSSWAIPGCFEKTECFNFSGFSKYNLYLWNMQGQGFPASDNWKLSLTLIPML